MTVDARGLLQRVERLSQGIDAIGQSRDRLTRRVFSVALIISTLVYIAVGLSTVFVLPGTPVPSYVPLLIWGPLTLAAASFFYWRGLSEARWSLWTG
jgi:hypothetical protein